MNFDSNIIQKTMQSLLTNITPKLFTTTTEKDEKNEKHEKKDKKKIHAQSHVDAVASILYDKMNTANVELTAQKNSGCFKIQESTIDIQSQVPHPNTFSDKYLSREMKEYIKHDSKK